MPARSILPANWEAPQVFRDRLGDRSGRQRAMASDGHLLLVLHAPPAADDQQRLPRFFWRSPDGTWRSSQFGGGAGALQQHLEEYEKLLEQYEAREHDATTSGEYFQVVLSMAPLVRAAHNLHHALADARKQLPEVRELINFRDRAYDLERNADLLYADAKNALDYLIARQSEAQAAASHRMAVSAHRLNVLAALFFPMVTLATIFGVNLHTGLEDALAPWPFLIVLGLGLFSGLVLAKTITRPPRAP